MSIITHGNKKVNKKAHRTAGEREVRGMSKEEKQAAEQLARWLEEEPKKEPRIESISVRDRLRDVIEYPRWWIWRKLHYWVAAWRVTAWYPKSRLKRNIPTIVCYTIRGVLRLSRGR